MASGSSDFEYDVALSFAGEDREKVEELAFLLKAAGFKVFYDNWETGKLWGEDLYEFLDEVYSKKARFCMMFLSAHYAAKAWTNHERKSAQVRAFRDNKDYILPIRLDDTEIPGIRQTVGYLDFRRLSTEEVAKIATQKLNATGASATHSRRAGGPPEPQSKPAPRRPKLNLKKVFTDLDREEFLEAVFDTAAKYFEESLAGLKEVNTSLVGRFQRSNTNHFTAKIYQDGRCVAQCGIRLGNAFGKGITYSNDPESPNSMNQGVSVVDDGRSMHLKAMMPSANGRVEDKLSADEAAEFFWNILVAPLQR